MVSSDDKGSSGCCQLCRLTMPVSFFWSVMACFFCLGFFFFPPCSHFVQSHILQRLSELMGFEWWERLVG